MKIEFSMIKSVIILATACLHAASSWALPEDFVYLDEAVPGIQIDLRYAGSNNFVGRPVVGYVSQRAVLTVPAAQALAAVQSDLKPFGLELLVFDSYRPQQAVDDFVAWAQDISDVRTKAAYYPHVDKRTLFSEGYIAARSGHSRGSTIDLTIVASGKSAKPLDMGTEFDYFGPESWPDYAGATAQQRANRLLLRTLMQKHGFKPYVQEWWHFTWGHEPYPDTYFNFIVN